MPSPCPCVVLPSLSAHARSRGEVAHGGFGDWSGLRVYSGAPAMTDPAQRPADVTQLLQAWSSGRSEVMEQLFAAIYEELRRLARSHLARESGQHTWQPTELVHEAFGRLVAQKVSWQNRHHFYGIAAQCMRRILVDYARKKKAAKRPTSSAAVPLEDHVAVSLSTTDRILIVDEALDRLAAANPRQAKIVELKYFGGLGIDEIAAVAGISPATVKRDWEEAKRMLFETLRT
jgi:RNA polymerase sigma-70 factor (ECF subfamily)